MTLCRDHGAACPNARALPGWTVTAGRTVEYNGVPVFNVVGQTDVRGYRYIPAALDTLTHDIAAALNAAGVDGSKVTR